MLKNKKAILFDLDGTLADSMWLWLKIDDAYGKKYGITFPENMHDEIEGKSFLETAVYFKEQFGLRQSLEEIMDEWNEMALYAYRNEIFLKDGAEELLLFLQEQGIKTAICTSNSAMLMDAIKSARPVLETIDVILTSGDVKTGKPSPEGYLKIAGMLSVPPEACLVFEDIPQGIQAGLNAGMEVCAVEDDFSADLRGQKKQLAHYYIKSFRQVLDGTYERLKK